MFVSQNPPFYGLYKTADKVIQQKIGRNAQGKISPVSEKQIRQILTEKLQKYFSAFAGQKSGKVGLLCF